MERIVTHHYTVRLRSNCIIGLKVKLPAVVPGCLPRKIGMILRSRGNLLNVKPAPTRNRRSPCLAGTNNNCVARIPNTYTFSDTVSFNVVHNNRISMAVLNTVRISRRNGLTG